MDAGAPGNHDGEDWYERLVTYNMTITAGNDSFISTDIVALVAVRQIEVGGVMVWKIVEWRDDFRRIKKDGHPGTLSTESPRGTTWGGVKSMFWSQQ